MRNLKKVLVMVLALAMMLSIMVVGAGAAFTDQKDIDSKHQEAVNMSVALNIIQGYPDGSFQPNGNVTRAEMAKIICIALNGGQEPATSVKPTPTFADIDGHWAEGFIEYCYAKGVVAGKSADAFDPSGNVTGSEAAKMLLVALGYNQDVEKYVGSDWALYVNVQANQDGLYKDLLDIETAEPLTREHAAQMIWNALQSKVIVKESQIDRTTGNVSDTYKYGDNEMLAKYYDGETFIGKLTDFTYNGTDKEWKYTVIADGGDWATFVSSNDYTDLFGMNVKAVYDLDGASKFANGSEYDAYGIFAKDSQVLFSGKIADLPNLSNDGTSVKFDGNTYKIDAGGDNQVKDVPVKFFMYNNDGNKGVFLADIAGKAGNTNISAYDAYSFCAISNDKDTSIDLVVVKPFVAAKVSYVSGSDIKLSLPNTVNQQAILNDVPMTFPTAKLEVGDDVVAYDGIAKNDYVCYVPAQFTKDNTGVVAKADLVSGKVTMNDDPDITVNGTTYTVDYSYGTAPGAGSILTDAVVINGFVFDIDSTLRKEVKDYAVITGIGADDGLNGDRVKILFNDNTQQVVSLAKGYTGMAIGDLVTYSVNSDNEYKLYEVAATQSEAGYDLFGNSVNGEAQVKKVSNSSNNVGYVTGADENGNPYTAAVNSNTVVFVQYTDGSKIKYKAISGDALKRVDSRDFDNSFSERFVLGTKQSKSSNQFDANLIYASTTSGKDLKDADTFFGYVTSAVYVENNNGDNAQQVKLWTKDGEKVLLTSDDTMGIQMRTVIEYKLNADGEISEIVGDAPYTVDSTAYKAATSSDNGYATVAITNWGSNVQFETLDGQSSNTLFSDFFETDKDTEILYIENTDHKGETEVAIGNADDKADGTGLVANAFLIFDDEGTIVLAVYDVDNEIAR